MESDVSANKNALGPGGQSRGPVPIAVVRAKISKMLRGCFSLSTKEFVLLYLISTVLSILVHGHTPDNALMQVSKM